MQGDLNPIPKSFTVLEPQNPKKNFKKEYVLMDAKFDCLNWNIKLDENSKYFEKIECVKQEDEIEFNSNEFDHYQLKLITKENISIIEDYYYNDNNDENNKNEKGKKDNKNDNNKLSADAIVGIVIGCVVVAAAIMVVEFFIVKKLSENKDAS